jgi:hypothetical protein
MVLRILLFFSVFVGIIPNMDAQQVLATDGSYSTSSQGSLSWTLGEVITETIYTTDNFLTQGFQQKLDGFLSIDEVNSNDDLSIFPNPFTSEITLSSSCSESNYQINIYDSQSKLVYTNEFFFSNPCEQLSIDLSTFPAGIYFFTIIIPATHEQYVQRIIKLKHDQ